MASSLLDPRYRIFSTDHVDGFVGFRPGWGAIVVLGDPVCPPDEWGFLVNSFFASPRVRGRPIVFAATTRAFSRWARRRGMGTIAFGEEVVLDPRLDLCIGKAGAKLRYSVNHAARQGITIEQYRPELGVDRTVEREVQAVSEAWLHGRRGLQMYAADLQLLTGRSARRYFVARSAGTAVAALVAIRMASRDGWLIDELMHVPDAPRGCSEALVVHALDQLGEDGAREVSFGVSMAGDVGEMRGLGRWSQFLARQAFGVIRRRAHLDNRFAFRAKFQPLRVEASYLVFNPPCVTIRSLLAMMTAFNVSWHRGRTPAGSSGPRAIPSGSPHA